MSFAVVQSTFDATQKKATIALMDGVTSAYFSATVPLQITGSETVAEMEKAALVELGRLLPQAVAEAIASLPAK